MSKLYNTPYLAPGMKVGIFGGSFNPAHRAHVTLSLAALRRLDLDLVIWLVSPQNPLKGTSDMASFEKRFDGAKLIARHPRLLVSDLENRLGSTYTAETLSRIKSLYPQVDFVWLMGSDNLIQFPKWKDWTRIMEMMPVAVFARPPLHIKAQMSQVAQRYARARMDATDAHLLAGTKPPRWTFIEDFLDPVSSTAIRTGQIPD